MIQQEDPSEIQETDCNLLVAKLRLLDRPPNIWQCTRGILRNWQPLATFCPEQVATSRTKLIWNRYAPTPRVLTAQTKTLIEVPLIRTNTI